MTSIDRFVGRFAGSVHLVGAGPGAPDLLTRRGLERLRTADVVLFDRLVSPELLDEAPARALRIDVGKISGPQPAARLPVTQEAISELLVEYARAGLVVVRLKGGDPFVFGRGAEELDACRAAGIPCEVVPGLSSALAAPALAGIAVTERGVARSFSVVTARQGTTTTPESGRGANVPPVGADTRVVLMGVAELPSIVAGLLAEGLAPSTPAALVASASLDHQRVLHSNLAEIVVATRRAAIEPPAVLVVGAAAGRARHPKAGPLTGFTVALTRPEDAARRTRALLAPTGARIVGSPLIEIEYREDLNDRGNRLESGDELVAQLGHADWIAFTSRHGVEGLWRALERRGLDTRSLAGNRLAVVGPGTAEALSRRGLSADLVAEPHRARALIDALARVRPSRVLFAGGSRARRELVEGLANRAIAVDERIVYDTIYSPPSPAFRRELENGVDAVVFASPSAARSYELQNLPIRARSSGHPSGKLPIAICLGPTTAEAAVNLGFRSVAVAYSP